MQIKGSEPDLYEVLFLDIKTISQYASLSEAPTAYRSLWEQKAQNLTKELEDASSIYTRSAIYAEFGRIVTISLGYFHRKSGVGDTLRISTFAGDEQQVLNKFCQALQAFQALHKKYYLCAHNGKEFDFPYIARRLLIHGIELPEVLQVSGKKPWETRFLDTLELWKFGDYKHYTSLPLLAYAFGVENQATEMDGSRVHDTYYQEHDLLKLATYCQHDTATCAQILRRMQGKTQIEEANIWYAPPHIFNADDLTETADEQK